MTHIEIYTTEEGIVNPHNRATAALFAFWQGRVLNETYSYSTGTRAGCLNGFEVVEKDGNLVLIGYSVGSNYEGIPQGTKRSVYDTRPNSGEDITPEKYRNTPAHCAARLEYKARVADSGLAWWVYDEVIAAKQQVGGRVFHLPVKAGGGFFFVGAKRKEAGFPYAATYCKLSDLRVCNLIEIK